MVTVYHYPSCSTCKKALKWLSAHKIEHKLLHIVDEPPTKKLLSSVLKESGIEVSKLFNTSGQVYREGGYKEKLTNMNEAEAIAALADNGKLIKRPLVVGGGVHLVGFKEEEYRKAFS